MLERVRQRSCRDACAHCLARGPERLACLRDTRCTPPALQEHGWRCCQWVATEEGGPPAAVPSEAAYSAHSDEIFRRLRWCLDQGPSHWPAQEHVHLAPGDDSRFVLGVPPWRADGSANPAGIPGSIENARDRPRGSVLLDDDVFGWECRACEQWVSMRPRAFVGAPEPIWWWWCTDCRTTRGVGRQSSKKEGKSALLASKCRKIEFAPVG